MRIISGKYKGRKIILPLNLKARPTTDFAKEGLFNILSHRIDLKGLTVLDLFSGTGFLSYEFASREASLVIAVELNPTNANFIRKTAKKFQMPVYTVEADAFRYIEKVKTQFDIIFCDPPYDMNGIERLPKMIFEHDLLNNDGLLIIEHSKKNVFTNNVHFLHQRSYGKVQFSFFSKNSEKYFFK